MSAAPAPGVQTASVTELITELYTDTGEGETVDMVTKVDTEDYFIDLLL